MRKKKAKHTGWTYEWTERKEKGRASGRNAVGTGDAEKENRKGISWKKR